jgi:acetolactate synthase-1/2/3 large subunit
VTSLAKEQDLKERRQSCRPPRTLHRKSLDADVVSGGRLVAKALRTRAWTPSSPCAAAIIIIYDGCLDEGIRIIDVRHEQVAAHAADGYARQTGKRLRGVRRRDRAAPMR